MLVNVFANDREDGAECTCRKAEGYTNLRGVVDRPRVDCAAAQREPERFDKQAERWRRKRHAKCCTGQNKSVHKGRLGISCWEAEKDLKLWVDTKWILSQQSALAAMKSKSITSCMRKSPGSTSREVIIPLSQPWSAPGLGCWEHEHCGFCEEIIQELNMRLRDLFSLEKRRFGGILSMCRNAWWEAAKEMDPGSSLCWQEATNRHARNSAVK